MGLLTFQRRDRLAKVTLHLDRVISGRGPTLFHGLSSRRQLELLSTQRFTSGVQALHFRRNA